MVFNGIREYNWKTLDDLALLSHNSSQMEDKATQLRGNSAKTGQKISMKKTKILRTNTTSNIPILLKEEPIEEVESFKYLGSIVDKKGGADKNVVTRTG